MKLTLKNTDITKEKADALIYSTNVQLMLSGGVSGYSYHTVPAVIYAGLKNDWNFRQTITEIIALGGCLLYTSPSPRDRG